MTNELKLEGTDLQKQIALLLHVLEYILNECILGQVEVNGRSSYQ